MIYIIGQENEKNQITPIDDIIEEIFEEPRKDNSEIEPIARIKNAATNSKIDIKDTHIYSPKSVIFAKSGDKIYINSLEGGETVVYDFPSLKQNKVIKHTFDAQNSHLFKDDESSIFDYKFYQNTKFPNHFLGKPVESALSHNGRYLWVTYYRRSYDNMAISPSAIAIIDTQIDEIVRVMPTGPLPKMVAVSHDEKTLAVVHWGDNTVALMDISGDNPDEFYYTHLLELNRQKNLSSLQGNRDKVCGECLRGTVFSSDDTKLFVARMGRGGIAVFDLVEKKYIGSVTNVANSPRHLAISKDGRTLFVSSNRSGIVTKFSVDEILDEIDKKGNANLRGDEIFVGGGARTLALSNDEKSLYVVSNNECKLVEIDIDLWEKVRQIDAPSYPVGLAVSPDGRYVVTTSQGKDGVGGNAVGVYKTKNISKQYYIIE